MEVNYALSVIVVGALLDTAIGDPYWMPHPIRVFGNMISFAERKFNRGERKRLKGALVWIFLVSFVFGSFFLVNWYLEFYPLWATVFGSVFFFYGISNRCLIEEGLKVEKLLRKGDLVAARKQLSMIVGRDTDNLSPSKIRSAVIETLSENLSDGVVAPLFYFFVGGIPAMMCYKMINTLDSMVGYKNEKYGEFGFFSAKCDDLANFIPARFTALFMVLVALSFRAFRFIKKYGRAHSSPNAGYPESAIAGILDCRLGGVSSYFGVDVVKPYIGENSREITHKDLVKCCIVNARVALLCYLLLILSVVS